MRHICVAQCVCSCISIRHGFLGIICDVLMKDRVRHCTSVRHDPVGQSV